MKILGYLKYAFSQMYRRKLLLFVEMFIICVSTCIVSDSIMNYYVVNEAIITVRDMLQEKTENIYKVSFDNRGTYNEETCGSIYDFCKLFCKDKTIKNGSIYYYDNMFFTNDYSICGTGVLVLNSSALALCKLRDNEGKMLELGADELVVGYDLAKDMPVNSVWHGYNDNTYKVTHTLKKGERWFADILIGTDPISVCLDNYAVVMLDFDKLAIDSYFGYILQNGVYFISDEENFENKHGRIDEISIESNCPVTVFSCRKMLDDYINTYRDEYFITNFQTVLMLVVSILALIISGIVNILSQKDNLLIMYRFGISRREHQNIHIMIHTFKSILAISVSCFFMQKIYINSFKYEIINTVLVISLVVGIIIVVFSEVISLLFLRRILNEVNRRE